MKWAFVIATLSVTGCAPECENEVLREIRSPSGVYRAVLFNRNCGATTGPNLQVSVLSAEEPATGSGNVFVAERSRDEPSGLQTPIDLDWRFDDELIIRHDPSLRVSKQEGRSISIRATYEVVAMSPVAPDARAPSCRKWPIHWSDVNEPVPHELQLLPFTLWADGSVRMGQCTHADGCLELQRRGTPIADDELARGLRSAAQLRPWPALSLRIEPGVSCQRVDQVRRLIDDAFGCHERSCNEGGYADE